MCFLRAKNTRFFLPRPGIVETNPEDWIKALRAAWLDVRAQIEGAGLAPELVSIGLSGQMHGFVPIGRDEGAVDKAITWVQASDSCIG